MIESIVKTCDRRRLTWIIRWIKRTVVEELGELVLAVPMPIDLPTLQNNIINPNQCCCCCWARGHSSRDATLDWTGLDPRPHIADISCVKERWRRDPAGWYIYAHCPHSIHHHRCLSSTVTVHYIIIIIQWPDYVQRRFQASPSFISLSTWRISPERRTYFGFATTATLAV